LHDLAGFGRAGGDRAADAGLELGVADAVLGDVQLGLGVVELRLRRAQRLLRLVEQGLRRETLGQQGLLSVEGVERKSEYWVNDVLGQQPRTAHHMYFLEHLARSICWWLYQ
jgi:hypothetical protein